MDLLTWTIKHRRLLAPGRPFDLSEHRYLVGIYGDTHPVVDLYKAGQMGASEYLISYALWSCDERRATTLYVFPTDGDVSDFSTARLGPAIEAEVSPYLASIVVSATGKGARGADRVTLKRIHDRFLYMRGGQVKPDGRASQLKSVDADVVILDEVDEMDARAPVIARKRLGHSKLAEERCASTPTYAGAGIHALWQEGDGRQWHIKCSGCGEWQAPTIDHVVVEWDALDRPVGWHGGPDGAFAACSRCSKPLELLGTGQWVAAYPGRDRHGYHINGLLRPSLNLLKLVRSMQTADESRQKEIRNQDLGLPFKPSGSSLTDEHLDACRRDYALGAKSKLRAFCGIDVGSVLHVVIRTEPDGKTGERRALFIGEVATFEEAAVLLRTYHVDKRGNCVVDALPETRAARNFQESFKPGVVWLAYYVPKGTKHADAADWNDADHVVNLDRTRSMDATFALFRVEENTLPANARDLPRYYAQMKAPVKRLVDSPDGNQRAVYVEASADHYAHAENYCCAAIGQGSRQGVFLGKGWREDDWEYIR